MIELIAAEQSGLLKVGKGNVDDEPDLDHHAGASGSRRMFYPRLEGKVSPAGHAHTVRCPLATDSAADQGPG